MQKVPFSMVDGAVGLRNVLINGGFDVWQRGTTNTEVDSGGFLADRWRTQAVGSSVSQSQQVTTLGLLDGEPAYHWRGIITAVAASTNMTQLTQAIENVRTLANQSATLSFWAKADATRQMAVELTQDFGTGGSPSASVTGIGATQVALTATWQKFTVPVSVPSIAGKTIGTDGGSLRVNFWLSAGSDFSARTAGTLGHVSGNVFLARVQLEAGTAASDFDVRPIGMELNLCRRYAQVLGGAVGQLGSGYFNSTVNLRATLPLLAPMRVTPTLTTRGGSSNFTALPGALVGSGLALGNSPTGGITATVDLTVAGATANAAGSLNCANAAGSILLVAELT